MSSSFLFKKIENTAAVFQMHIFYSLKPTFSQQKQCGHRGFRRTFEQPTLTVRCFIRLDALAHTFSSI